MLIENPEQGLPTFVIDHIVKGQWEAGRREERIRQTASVDDPLRDGRVKIWIEQEPGSGGKESGNATLRNLFGFVASLDKVSDSKEARAEPFSSQVAAGTVYLCESEEDQWIKSFLSECELFPNGNFRDQVDAASGAFNALMCLNRALKRAGRWGKRSSTHERKINLYNRVNTGPEVYARAAR
jgi:predicted phage terminase large subunit-like protein